MHELKTQVVVLGSGPGGYSAAFRAADLGKQVVLVERYENLGGVCLNVGCIPSKALLHAARILDETKQFQTHGITFGDPQIDITQLRSWKDSIIKRLTTGLKGLAKQRKVTLLTGVGKFISANQIEVATTEGPIIVTFENAIIAVGSAPVKLPFIPKDPRIMDSTDALNLAKIPTEMLVIGGGIIGLEMATVYSSLGSKITIVELMPQLIPGVDADIIRPLQQYNAKKIAQILLSTRVSKVEAKPDGIWATFEGEKAPTEPKRFDRILVAVGRTPNGKLIAAEKAGINFDKKVNQWNDDEQAAIRNIINSEFKVEGALRSETQMNIKRLLDIACYRGLRHRKGLPVRGQRTKTNSRTRKGKRKTVAGKKKAAKK